MGVRVHYESLISTKDVIAPVALQNVDVIDVEPLQAVLHGCEDVLEQRSAPDVPIPKQRGWVTLRESP